MSVTLWIIAAALIILWLVRGVFHIVHWAVHLFLLIALVAIVVGFLTR